jgi:hypothetical protein
MQDMLLHCILQRQKTKIFNNCAKINFSEKSRSTQESGSQVEQFDEKKNQR